MLGCKVSLRSRRGHVGRARRAGLVVDGVGGLWRSHLLDGRVDVLAEREAERRGVMMLEACLWQIWRLFLCLVQNINPEPVNQREAGRSRFGQTTSQILLLLITRPSLVCWATVETRYPQFSGGVVAVFVPQSTLIVLEQLGNLFRRVRKELAR